MRCHLIVIFVGLASFRLSLTNEQVGAQVKVPKQKLVANWSTFNVLSEVNPQDARDFVTSFPIMTFWDSLKGSFRTGAIADSVAALYPSLPGLVSKVDKRINHAGQHYKIKHSIVDNNFIFMNMLVTIQSLIQQYEIMSATVENFRRTSEFSSLLQDFQHSLQNQSQQGFCDDQAVEGIDPSVSSEICQFALIDAEGNYLLDSHEEINQRIEIHNQMELMLNLTHELNQLDDSIQRDIMTYQKNERINQRKEIHDSLMQAIEEHRQHLINGINQKEKELEKIFVTAEEKEFAQQKQDLQDEYDMTIASLQEEINLTMALIAYRHQEEMKMIEESEAHEQHLLSLKHEYLRKSTEEIVSVFFNEIISFFLYLFQDIWFVLWWGRILLLSITVIVTLLEVSQSIQVIYHKLNIQRNRLYSKAIRDRSWTMFFAKYIPGLSSWVYLPLHGDEGLITIFQKNMKKQRLIYDEETIKILHNTFYNFSIAFNHQTSLPNFLFCGAPGCGKSITTTLFTDSLQNIAYIRLSGADILALGNYSNTFLKEIFQRYNNNKIQILLIIDEADHLIASRDRKKAKNTMALPNTQQGAIDSTITQLPQPKQPMIGSNCLFALLEGIRESSPYISLMLTTRLSIDKIDIALLDRMDNMIHFPLPSWKQRFDFICEHIQDLLEQKNFLSIESERDEVLRLSLIHSDSNVTRNHIQNILQSLSINELKSHLRDHDIEQRVIKFVKKVFGGNSNGISSTVSTSQSTAQSRRSQPQPSRVIDPELDHQPAPAIDSENGHQHHKMKSTEDLHQMIRKEALAYIEQRLSLSADAGGFSSDACNVQLCVKAMVLCSHGWSYRDLQKRLMNLQYSVSCSERLVVLFSIIEDWLLIFVYFIE